MVVDAKTLLDLLMQLLFVSLLVERIVAVIWQGVYGARETDDVNAWSRKHVAVAVAASALVCVTYDLDFFETAMAAPAEWSGIGIALTALVLAGGSAGIRKLSEAVAEMAKASKNESQARAAAAKATSAALQRRPVIAPPPPQLVGMPAAAVAPAALAPALPNVANSNAQRIIDQCEALWPQDSGDCSAFARDVCAALGVQLQGNADAIVDAMAGAEWVEVASGEEAKQLADAGQLVLAGLKSANHAPTRQHGHVVVVVSGPLEHGKYPTAYWGSLGGVGARYRGINWAWTGADRDRVTYAARVI